MAETEDTTKEALRVPLAGDAAASQAATGSASEPTDAPTAPPIHLRDLFRSRLGSEGSSEVEGRAGEHAPAAASVPNRSLLLSDDGCLAVGAPAEAPRTNPQEDAANSVVAMSWVSWNLIRERARVEWLNALDRRQAFSLADLKKFPAIVILACWHTYAIWLAATAAVCFAANMFLTWYVEWYRAVPAVNDPAKDFPYLPFFAISMRSWLMVQLTSEMLRICYLLGREAWCLDTFGSYRKTILGLATDEMYDADGLVLRWPRWITKSWHFWVDRGVQIAIYLSFDAIPFLTWIISLGAGSSLIHASALGFQALLGASLLHIIAYLLSRTATDVYMKFQAFKTAWSSDRPASQVRRRIRRRRRERELALGGAALPTMFPSLQAASVTSSFQESSVATTEAGVATPGPPIEAARFCSTLRRFCADARNMLLGLVKWLVSVCCCFWRPLRPAFAGGGNHRGDSFDDQPELSDFSRCSEDTMTRFQSVHETHRDRAMQTDPPCHDLEATRLNVCVPVCSWLDLVQWELLAIVAIIGLWVFAFESHQAVLIVFCVMGTVGLVIWRCRWTSTPSWQQKAKLQEWAEKHCALDTASLAGKCRSFEVVLLLQALLFGLARQWTGVAICFIALSAVVVREVSVHYQGNNGWWIGILEGLVVWFAVTYTNFKSDAAMGFLTLVLAALHQLGLARRQHKGARLVNFVQGLLYCILVTVVGAVLLTAATPAKASKWSAFEKGLASGAQNWTVPPRDTSNLGLACQSRFSTGPNAPGGSISIPDFSLFSALAYESQAAMQPALAHFFPDWNVKYRRVVGLNNSENIEDQADWTTFFEYENANQTVSVIAIRGTDTTLDILNDISLWMPAVLMQGFELLGPWMSQGVTEAVAFWSHLAFGGPSQQYFSKLLEYVRKRKRDDPSRKFYLTGHSLGGGLAKIVASQEQIQAVTFMAPGLERTNYLVFQTPPNGSPLVNSSVTIQPKDDIISRVDTQIGAVIPTGCDKDPLTCHSIYEAAVCPLFDMCGSMRPDAEPIRLPCGQCRNRPCVNP